MSFRRLCLGLSNGLFRYQSVEILRKLVCEVSHISQKLQPRPRDALLAEFFQHQESFEYYTTETKSAKVGQVGISQVGCSLRFVLVVFEVVCCIVLTHRLIYRHLCGHPGGFRLLSVRWNRWKAWRKRLIGGSYCTIYNIFNKAGKKLYNIHAFSFFIYRYQPIGVTFEIYVSN